MDDKKQTGGSWILSGLNRRHQNTPQTTMKKAKVESGLVAVSVCDGLPFRVQSVRFWWLG